MCPKCDRPVALVTGSGSGIGRGIAERLAADGYEVVINDVALGERSAEDAAAPARPTAAARPAADPAWRGADHAPSAAAKPATGPAGRAADPAKSATGAYATQDAIAAATGRRPELVRGDVASDADRRAVIEFVAERHGRLDLLVNNAGVAPLERHDILEATPGSFDRVLGINLRGPYFLTQLAANRMIAWKRDGTVPQPRIVFITSVSAYTSSPNRGEYCISKAGLAMAAQLYAHRLGEFGIPVIAIAPGIVSTNMTAGVRERYDRLIAEGLLVTRRWGQPEDVAAVVSAFARGDLDYSTGQCIEVGGGIGLRRL